MRDAEAISKLLSELIQDADENDASLLAYILRAAKIEAEGLIGRKCDLPLRPPEVGVIVPFEPRR